VDEMLERYVARRGVMVEGLSAVPGLRCPMPEGAFYAFPDVSALYARKGVEGSVGFCDKLLAEAHVAVVPGDAFGDDRSVRFSFSSSRERIREGVRRFAEWAAR
jgi:aspartate aminotransferase